MQHSDPFGDQEDEVSLNDFSDPRADGHSDPSRDQEKSQSKMTDLIPVLIPARVKKH